MGPSTCERTAPRHRQRETDRGSSPRCQSEATRRQHRRDDLVLGVGATTADDRDHRRELGASRARGSVTGQTQRELRSVQRKRTRGQAEDRCRWCTRRRGRGRHARSHGGVDASHLVDRPFGEPHGSVRTGGNRRRPRAGRRKRVLGDGPGLRDHPHVVSRRLGEPDVCLLYTSPSPRDGLLSRMPSSA